MFNHRNTPSYFLKNTKVLSSSHSDLMTSQRHDDVTQDVRDKCLSPTVRVRNVTKHLQSPSVTTHPRIKISSSSSLIPRDSREQNTEINSGNISANVGGGRIPRDTEAGENSTSQTVTQIPIQIKQVKRSASPLTSLQAKEEIQIEQKRVGSDANTNFDSGQEYKSVTVSTHWSWDDIFHTVNTTDEEGRHKYRNSIYVLFFPSDKNIDKYLSSYSAYTWCKTYNKCNILLTAYTGVMGNEAELQITTRIIESANSSLFQYVM